MVSFEIIFLYCSTIVLNSVEEKLLTPHSTNIFSGVKFDMILFRSETPDMVSPESPKFNILEFGKNS